MQGFAHAVQPLEFEILPVAGYFQNRRDAVRVVRGKLRIDAVGHVEQLRGAADIADVRGRFGGEDGKVGHAVHLRALDLAVPIGALDQPDHDLAVELGRQRIEPVEHETRPLAEGLHHDAETVPSRKAGIAEHHFDHVERQAQAIGFLGIDIETDIGIAGGAGQFADAFGQLGHGLGLLAHLVAGIERRQLDRETRIFPQIVGHGDPGDFLDRIGIGSEIFIRAFLGDRCFPEHVIGIGCALFLPFLGPFQRQLHILAEHELVAQFLHRLAHGEADDRLAQALDRAAQGVERSPAFRLVDHAARHFEGVGGGVDQRAFRLADMVAPVGRADLVLDQVVDRLIVGDTQQRFGQRHQRQPFVGGQAIFAQETLGQRGSGGAAHFANHLDRPLLNPLAHIFVGAEIGNQIFQNFRLIGAMMRADLVPEVDKSTHESTCSCMLDGRFEYPGATGSDQSIGGFCQSSDGQRLSQ